MAVQKIKSFFLETVNIKREEVPLIKLLFFHSFFLGFFISFYFVTANSQFIEHFGSSQLPLAYMVSGAVGYLMSVVYSYFQKKVKSETLFLGATAFMGIIAIIARFDVEFIPVKLMSFFVFIWAWPFISLVGTVTGAFSLRLLDLIQVKRLFGIINLGGVSAAILGYMLIPVFIKLLGNQYNLLFIGLLGIIVSIILTIIIYKRYPEKSPILNVNQKGNDEISLMKLLKNKYFFLIFLSTILSMVVIYISDFGFLASIKIQKNLFADANQVSRFLAFVFAGLKIGELIMSLLSSRMLSKYGVKLGLTILPVSCLLFILIASITGLFVGAESIIFLVAMTLNKSFERIFRRSLDDPAFNVIFQTLPDNQKHSIQAKVSVAMQLSIAIAGFMLFLQFSLFKTADPQHFYLFPLFALPLMILWVIVAVNLYDAYKSKIKQILDEKKSFRQTEIKEFYATQVLEKHLLVNDLNAVKLSVVIVSETNPQMLDKYCDTLLKLNDPIITKALLKNIDPTYELYYSDVVKEIFENPNLKTHSRLVALKSLERLDFANIGEIETLKESNDTKDKFTLIKYLINAKQPIDFSILIHLLDDKDSDVVKSAIKLANLKHSPDVILKLISMLQMPEYCHKISNVLINIGKDYLNEIDHYFEQKTPKFVLLKIVEIFAKIKTNESQHFMLSHINFPDREIQMAIIQGLYYSEFKAKNGEIVAIKQKIKEVVDNILWIIVSIKDLAAKKNTLRLIQALDVERERNYELLFFLLSFIYPPELVDLIKTNIIGSNTIYALELIDNFFAVDVKQLIIPLFDKITINQRIKRLRMFFQHRELGFNERIKDIILKDYRKVDSWTKIKALELLGKVTKTTENAEDKESATFKDLKDFEIEDYSEGDVWTEEIALRLRNMINKGDLPDEVFVCLHHPDELVYSSAAKLIFDESPIRCIIYLKTLSEKKQELIDALTKKIDKEHLLLAEKLKLLKRIFLFFGVPESCLVKLAKLVESVRLKKDEILSIENQQGEADYIVIILNGILVYKDTENEEIRYHKNDIIIKGINIQATAKKLVALKDTHVIKLNRFEYFNLVALEIDIISSMFEGIKK